MDDVQPRAVIWFMVFQKQALKEINEKVVATLGVEYLSNNSVKKLGSSLQIWLTGPWRWYPQWSSIDSIDWKQFGMVVTVSLAPAGRPVGIGELHQWWDVPHHWRTDSSLMEQLRESIIEQWRGKLSKDVRRTTQVQGCDRKGHKLWLLVAAAPALFFGPDTLRLPPLPKHEEIALWSHLRQRREDEDGYPGRAGWVRTTFLQWGLEGSDEVLW